MMPSALQYLRKAFAPSLALRLLLAQMVMLTALWVALLLVVSYMTRQNIDTAENATSSLFHTVLKISDALANLPVKRETVLSALAQSLNSDYENEGIEFPYLTVMQVRSQGQLVFDSHPQLPEFRNTKINTMETVEMLNKKWRVRTMRSATTGTEVTFATPDLIEDTFWSFTWHGYYFVPLLISLPFLALPAWWSVRQALRPWNQVRDELAARGPNDLKPLEYEPRHVELRPFVHSINSLLTRVSESTARERALVANAAHELRTPLAAMRVSVEALQEITDDPRQQALMHHLLRGNERATRMVAQLLQLTRNEAGYDHATLQLLHLETLVQDRLALLEPLASTRDIELDLHDSDLSLPLRGDRDGLLSLIDNLVENAIKYSPDGGTVTVRLERYVKANITHARLWVEDHGPGIPAALRERVFYRFFRAPDQEQSGSGLGLAIARSAAERHGGHIHLHDAVSGTGLRVCVELPLDATPVSACPECGKKSQQA